jgi:hypothetical protein
MEYTDLQEQAFTHGRISQRWTQMWQDASLITRAAAANQGAGASTSVARETDFSIPDCSAQDNCTDGQPCCALSRCSIHPASAHPLQRPWSVLRSRFLEPHNSSLPTDAAWCSWAATSAQFR